MVIRKIGAAGEGWRVISVAGTKYLRRWVHDGRDVIGIPVLLRLIGFNHSLSASNHSSKQMYSYWYNQMINSSKNLVIHKGCSACSPLCLGVLMRKAHTIALYWRGSQTRAQDNRLSYTEVVVCTSIFGSMMQAATISQLRLPREA